MSTQRFTLLEGEDCAAFTTESLTKKWSIRAFEQHFYDGETLHDQHSAEDIKENLYTIEFKADGRALIIDLFDQYNYEQGVYRMLDNHNLVVDFDFEDDDPGSLIHLENVQWPYWIFERVSFATEPAQSEVLRSVSTFSMTENSGDEPAFGQDELPGQWQITAVEALQEPGPGEDNEGPVVGMVLQFDTNGTGQVSMQGEKVIGLAYEMLDMSTLLLRFENEEDEDQEDSSHNLFHVNARSGGEVALTIYSPMREEGPQGDSHSGGAEFRLTIKKQ